jgi:hypothetical protein
MSSMSAHCFLGIELSVLLVRKQGLSNRVWSFGCRRTEEEYEGPEDFSRSRPAKAESTATSAMSLGGMNQEILNDILMPLIKPKQKASSNMIRKTLMELRLVCQQFKFFADIHCCSMFPDSFMHIILAKHNPCQLERFFRENSSARESFERVTDISNQRFTLHKFESENSGKRMIQLEHEYFEVLKDVDSEFEQGSACTVRQWMRESAIEELKESLNEMQKPYLDYYVKAGAVSFEDIEYHAFCVHISPPDFTFNTLYGGAEDESRFFLALKYRTLESAYEEYGVVKSSKARQIRDVHLREMDMSPVSPHAKWILSRILTRLSRVGDPGRDMKAGQIAALAEPVQDDHLSWKFLSRASFTYI